MSDDLDENPRAFLDVCIGDDGPTRRITIRLFHEDTPKAVDNFLMICRGDAGSINLTNPNRLIRLCYSGCTFHRVVDGFMIQSGDITLNDGRGGMSVLDQIRDEEFVGDPAEEKTFEDENLGWKSMNEAGLVCMANRGPDTNTSQFFITLDDCSFLDGKHTVFGKVETGLDVVRDIGKVKVGENNKPVEDVVIVDCGQYFPESPQLKSHHQPPPPRRPRSRSPSQRRHRRHRDHHHRRRSRSPRRHHSRSRSPRRHKRHRDDDEEEYTRDDPDAEERILREEREREGRRWDNMPSNSAADEPEVKFKGRGTMRYRERKRWGGAGDSYGRLN
ncbi:cyclophilin-like domain-containing protein [Tricharina praecox]|uniref:cyclophilin-like domain-containing protein n=1 Tax=Tricharina praecox TaxID=43433 RepID=UPI0022208FEF|nr:cyclophilin-like domain-containing protein [Tricharina praecox]KAI5858611.1 cyclophilin-like domain-containing protein [Tricharina praecox]